MLKKEKKEKKKADERTRKMIIKLIKIQKKDVSMSSLSS
jgi:hypothetical protein